MVWWLWFGGFALVGIVRPHQIETNARERGSPRQGSGDLLACLLARGAMRSRSVVCVVVGYKNRQVSRYESKRSIASIECAGLCLQQAVYGIPFIHLLHRTTHG